MFIFLFIYVAKYKFRGEGGGPVCLEKLELIEFVIIVLRIMYVQLY